MLKVQLTYLHVLIICFICKLKMKIFSVNAGNKNGMNYCAFSTRKPTSLTSCKGLSRMFCSISKW
jgi:hypothetical protein